MLTTLNFLGISILSGLIGALLVTCIKYNMRLWCDIYMADFLTAGQTGKINLHDFPLTRFLYFVHASSIPLVIALLLTHIVHEQPPMPDIVNLRSQILPSDFATKNMYWKRRIAYANT